MAKDTNRANFDDIRVCGLAVAISEAPRREIAEMDWLIEDINTKGAATTTAEAEARPVSEYDYTAGLECPTD
ncbi:hypothetical protein ACHABQ_13945 [Nesterenkonia aurantiaca]|uniref:hypothetical protein n=1 Tax=Nesterenkonia aurantiaca TaxID=1436010 RepID=UPI003EE7E817